MKTHCLMHRHSRRRERDMWWLLTAYYINQFNENLPPKAQKKRKGICSGYPQPNTSNKTHRLIKHRHDRRREKRYVVVILAAYITSNTSLKTHPLKHRHDRRRKVICDDYSLPSTSNNSMKTHRLKHRHNQRREKRYVVVTHSLLQTIQ